MWRLSSVGLIFLSLFIAFLLMILPLPNWMQNFQPEFVLIVTLFWVLNMPHRIGIGMAWIIGLIFDGMQGTLLGENALCFAILAYFMYKIHHRFKLLSAPFQLISIFILILFNQFIIFWIQGLQGHTLSFSWFFGSALITTLFWPWISMLLSNTMKRYHLN